MGKISPVSAKYIIQAAISINGIVEKPDVIGAVFGQTEGLLGSDLELRELQKNGRIGRIEVNLTVNSGKTEGQIIIPSSLDKEETTIIAAAIETIQKIGPCDSKVKVEKIEDVRVSKRDFVLERAKELLKNLTQDTLPDSRELRDEVAHSGRTAEIIELGQDRLAAGPDFEESEEVIIVEGRADVLNLLKYGFKNVLGLAGSKIPASVAELVKGKIVIAFVDGDRGGDIILNELNQVIKIDFIAKAPSGEEVEELSGKDIHKALRSKVSFEEEFKDKKGKKSRFKESKKSEPKREERKESTFKREVKHKDKFKALLDELIGTKGAFILDKDLHKLGKVPVTELVNTIRSLRTGIYAIVLDGTVEKDLAYMCERASIKFLIAKDNNVERARVRIFTAKDLE
ncbi:MAG: DNA primase DnaG [Candidatus Nanoarchaeia archaeon]|nr:DNA primase DnaG [Candidatus Nanoarchaeia archaeon]MDD5588129.1 DNA primase DnaG [Candidatus Nanoarchaeia archaeon]